MAASARAKPPKTPRGRPSASVRKQKSPPLGDAAARLEALASQLVTASERLERMTAEAPKAVDFEPLAEHLYTFAVSAPRLLHGLEEVPRAAATIQASLVSLREVAETLHFSNDRLADALLKVPRAEDYEPLAAPLREFARVAPALAESLAEVMRVARSLAERVPDLSALGKTLSSAQRTLAETTERMEKQALPPGVPQGVLEALQGAAERMVRAETAIDAALASLPRDPEYGRFAAQLRELAAVSPSLLEWLAQVPQLTAPLEASVGDLRSAATGLKEGHAQVRRTLEELSEGSG